MLLSTLPAFSFVIFFALDIFNKWERRPRRDGDRKCRAAIRSISSYGLRDSSVVPSVCVLDK